MSSAKPRKRELEDVDFDALANFDRQSEHSALSASQGSASSLNSNIVKLGTQEVNALVWSSSITYLIGAIIEGVYYFMDMHLILYYAGVDGMNALACLRPLEVIFARAFPGSLMAVAGTNITLLMARSHVKTAMAYFNHSFLLCLVWCLLVTLVITPLAPLIYRAVEGNNGVEQGAVWFQLLVGLGSWFAILAQNSGYILDAESRVFASFMRQTVWGVVCITMECFLTQVIEASRNKCEAFTGEECMTSLTPMMVCGIGSIVGNAIIFAWMLVLFIKVPVLDLPIKGNMRFSRHGMWPLRPKVMLTLLKEMFAKYFSEISQPLAIVIAIAIVSSIYTNQGELRGLRASTAVYTVVYQLTGSVSKGFTRGFTSVVQYNIMNSFFGRVKRIIAVSVVWQLVLSIVVSILLFLLSDVIFRGLVPGNLPEDIGNDPFRDRGPLNLRLATITPGLMGGFDMAVALLSAEHKNLVVILLQAARILSMVITTLVTILLIGDGCKVVYAFVFGDIAPIIAGYGYLVYYNSKYSYLADVEQARKKQQELERQLEELEADQAAPSPRGEVPPYAAAAPAATEGEGGAR